MRRLLWRSIEESFIQIVPQGHSICRIQMFSKKKDGFERDIFNAFNASSSTAITDDCM